MIKWCYQSISTFQHVVIILYAAPSGSHAEVKIPNECIITCFFLLGWWLCLVGKSGYMFNTDLPDALVTQSLSSSYSWHYLTFNGGRCMHDFIQLLHILTKARTILTVDIYTVSQSYNSISFTTLFLPIGNHYKYKFFCPIMNKKFNYFVSVWMLSKKACKANSNKNSLCIFWVQNAQVYVLYQTGLVKSMSKSKNSIPLYTLHFL